MWLLTAVGPVHGQREFTFVLEKNRTYTIGRDKGSDICFQSKAVYVKAGSIQVGDWSPADVSIQQLFELTLQRNTPPPLVWKAGTKKNGSLLPTKIISLTGKPASTDREDYTDDGVSDTAELVLEDSKGLELANDSWFCLKWQPLHISYDKMKDEDEDFTAGLRNCCVSWTGSLQAEDLAQVVVSGACKRSKDCLMGVCYGLPIVSEQWVYALANRLRACWKKIADSEDSFSVPDPLDSRFRPPIDPSLKSPLSSPEFWTTRPKNPTLFEGWCVLALRGTKYYVAMGAQWEEVDVCDPLPLSAADFHDRIAPIVKAYGESGTALTVMYVPSVKKELVDKGVNFDSVIVQACSSHGIFLASGRILWGSMLCGGVQRYFELQTSKEPDETTKETSGMSIVPPSVAPISIPAPLVPASSAVLTTAAAPVAAEIPADPVPPEPTTGKRLTRRAASATSSRAASRAPSVPPPVPQPTSSLSDAVSQSDAAPRPDAVPSTFLEDTATKAADEPPKKTKKPLKRRAGREMKTDTFDDLDMDEASQPSLLFQPSHVPETQVSSGSQPSASLASRVPDSVMDIDIPSVQPSLPSTRTGGRLKRRAGVGPTQSAFLSDVDTSVAYAERAAKEEKNAKTRALYEELNRETLSMQPAFKRARREGSESVQPESDRAALMQIDEENDYVSRALRSVRAVKREKPSPTKGTTSKSNGSSRQTSPVKRRDPEPIEEEEEPEPELQTRKPTKRAEDAPKRTSQPDKDENFLQAISKTSRSKKDIDELDKEFNQLRIPKPNTKTKATIAWEAPSYDYSVLKDFDDDMRGNFIEVVYADLFRKDTPKVVSVPDNDGRPNFKKFKKKNIIRHQPVTLVLSAQQAQAEMGEPYWHTETMQTQARKTQGRSQANQSQMGRGEFSADEGEVDIVPRVQRSTRTQKAMATQIEDDEEDFTPLLPASTARRRGATPLTQQSDLGTHTRRSRAGSAMSDTSSVAASAIAAPARPTATATGRARRGTQARPLILDDSDEDNGDGGTLFSGTAAATGRSSRLRGAAAAGPSAKTSTLDAGETLSRPTRSTQAAATLRRKIISDGDDIGMQGAQKKRRVR